MSRRDERGTAAVELVLVAPVLIVVLLLVVGLSRYASARQHVEGVAADAARAASLERQPSLSVAAADRMARDSLGRAGVSCGQLTVQTDISAYRPGGVVSTTVTCVADLSDVALAGLPGTKSFTATATVPIEEFRSQ